MMMGSTSPFSRKKGIKRSPNKYSYKKKIEDEDTKYISDKDDLSNITYEYNNQINFPQKSELSVKSSNTHKIASFNKNRKSDKFHAKGIPYNNKKDPRARLNPNRVQALKKKHLRKKSLVLLSIIELYQYSMLCLIIRPLKRIMRCFIKMSKILLMFML